MPYCDARRKAGLPTLLVRQVNHHTPFMPGDADLDATDVDIV